MPLIRAEVRNEYGLGQPQLYKDVNREDPKAVLDGVAVSGLVGILRQLGDLAEFAAEVFHGLQEQVMSTASRSHKLMIRVQRIEAALPPLEKAVLAQTSHIHFAYTAGSEWHPRIRYEKNHFIYNDLPRFIMDSYELCRDPPRLHLLDKFDAGEPGSCLKRYSDPTYFKRASGSFIEEDTEKVRREKKTRKSKKRRASHKNGELSRASLSNRSGRMQYTSPIVNGRTSSSQTASTFDMSRKSDLEEHSNSFDSRTGSGYECVLNLGSSVLPEEWQAKEVSSGLMKETDSPSSDFPVEQTLVVVDNFSYISSREKNALSSSCVTCNENQEIAESKAKNKDRDDYPEMNVDEDVQETRASNLGNSGQIDIPSTYIDSFQSSSIQNENDETESESEPDNYMDALNTIESESENDIECHTKQEVESCSENGVECHTKREVECSENNVGCHTKQEVEEHSENGVECHTKREEECSENGVECHTKREEECSENNVECHAKQEVEEHSANGVEYHTKQEVEEHSENGVECHTKQEVEGCSENDFECQTKWEQSVYANNEKREDEMRAVIDDDAGHYLSQIESSASTDIISNSEISTSLPDPVPLEKFASEKMPPISGKSLDPDHSLTTNLCISEEIRNGSQIETVIKYPSSSGSTIPEMQDPAGDTIIKSVSSSQNSQTEFSGVHSVGFWTNGGLLGLQPSKPSDFAVPTAAQSSAAKGSEAFGPPNQNLLPKHDGHKGNWGTVVEDVESNEKVQVSCSEKASFAMADLDDNLGKPVNSHCNNNIDNVKGNGWSLNTPLLDRKMHQANPNVKATPVESGEGNDDNSSRMFGLGHKLLVNGFRRKLSIGHDGESEPATSTKTGALDQRDGHQSISYQKIPWTAFNEQIGNGSPVNSLTSSPPLDHMKISFNPIDRFETSKLRLQFPDGKHYQEIVRDMFPSFQLVPGPSIQVHDVASDSDDDTFCRSSPYMSDDCLSHCSDSNSEQWESGEILESKDPELYDALSRLSSLESASSSLQVGETANSGVHVNGEHNNIVPGVVAESSLPLSLDLPSFEAINPELWDESKSNFGHKNHPELQTSMERKPLPPPPPPPVQWRVSKPFLDDAEERQYALSESLRHELDQKLLGSIESEQPKPPSAKHLNDEAFALKSDNKVDMRKLNRQKEINQLSGGQGMDEKEDFLQQIRTKSFNLRPTVTAKPNVISGPTANVKVTAILQKANAIRQAVGSDDGEDDDNWSDT